MSGCIYMDRNVLKGWVRFLISERTQDYRSQMEAGATPTPVHALSFSILPLSPPPQATAWLCLQRKILGAFSSITSAKPELEALLGHGGMFKF